MYDAGAYVLYNLHRLPVMQKFSTSIRSPYYFDTFASYATALAVFRKREPPEYNLKPLPSLKSNPNSNENLASFAVNGSIRYTVGPESVKVKSKPVAVEPPDNTVVQDRRSGVVFFGSQTILSLEDAKRIRSERAAEARVTDPALIALFARSYRCPNTVRADDLALSPAALASLAVGEDGEVDNHRRDQLLSQQRREQMYHLAQRACQSNLEVAMSAGLHCRVAVWTTLLSLLPVPDPSAGLIEEVTFAEGVLSPLHLLRSATYTPHITSADTSGPNSGPPSSHANRRGILVGGERPVKVAPRESFPELPFTFELIGTLLSELLEGGDVQHFVVACEILRTGSVLPDICRAVNLSEARVQRGYLVYLDLLSKLELFCEATDLLKATEDKYMSTLNKVGVQVGMKCATCGKEMSSETATGWCERCERCVSICVVCHRPATGLVHWCPLCAHGGHLACTQRWFRQSDDCPAGCGHNCCSTLQRAPATHARPAFRRMESLFELEYCLNASTGVRSRSATTARPPLPTVPSGVAAAGFTEAPVVSLPPGVTVSPRTLQRQHLRHKKLAAMQAAGHHI
jgi:DNA-directed RNA polymerase subunit RPC12/RpoP